MHALLLIAMSLLAQDPAAPKPVAKEPSSPGAKRPLPDQATLEKQFEEMLTGATLAGSFTADDAPNEPPRTDRYKIDKVTKLKNDYWLFESTVEYEAKKIPIRIPLEVKWAGDTAVITLTDVFFPGLGTFTARVLVYRGQYAGIWQGESHGGQMYGKIEKAEEPKAEEKEGEAKSE